uniref:Uncharacterized protein n=1 Tax=Mesocestoides corti TaxID=53468 RepID=A0A5K3FK72_MESCO
MANTTANNSFPVPSKRQFARYICLGGTSFQRINTHGVEHTSFFCADKRISFCSPLEHASDQGNLTVNKSVAIWRPHNGGQWSVFYCAHGVWHRLGGGPFPQGVTVKYPRKTNFQSTVPTEATTLSVPLSTIPASTESKLEAQYFPTQRAHPPWPNALRTTPKTLSLSSSFPLNGFSPHSTTPEETHLPLANVIIFAENVPLALHEQLYQYTLITFYGMIAIGLVALVSGLMALLLMCRRKARLTAEAAEAQKRLKSMISVV